MGRLGMGEILVLLVVVLVLFGGTRLPQLGSSLGQAIRNFKRGFEGSAEADEAKPAPAMAAGQGATDAERAKVAAK